MVWMVSMCSTHRPRPNHPPPTPPPPPSASPSAPPPLSVCVFVCLLVVCLSVCLSFCLFVTCIHTYIHISSAGGAVAGEASAVRGAGICLLVGKRRGLSAGAGSVGQSVCRGTRLLVCLSVLGTRLYVCLVGERQSGSLSVCLLRGDRLRSRLCRLSLSSSVSVSSTTNPVSCQEMLYPVRVSVQLSVMDVVLLFVSLSVCVSVWSAVCGVGCREEAREARRREEPGPGACGKWGPHHSGRWRGGVAKLVDLARSGTPTTARGQGTGQTVLCPAPVQFLVCHSSPNLHAWQQKRKSLNTRIWYSRHPSLRQTGGQPGGQTEEADTGGT
jgi:hypothetical protein